MISLCIPWPIEPGEHHDLERQARRCAEAVHRCGGVVDGYYLPAPLATRPDRAFALVRFDDIAMYERYRETLAHTLPNVEVAANKASLGKPPAPPPTRQPPCLSGNDNGESGRDSAWRGLLAKRTHG